MKNAASMAIVAALGAIAIVAVNMRRGTAQFIVPGDARYLTGCEALDATTVEGFVKNPGAGVVQINGLARFSFTVANAVSRPAVQVPVDAVIPAGRTASVARARLVTALLPNEVCQFDVSGAVR